MIFEIGGYHMDSRKITCVSPVREKQDKGRVRHSFYIDVDAHRHIIRRDTRDEAVNDHSRALQAWSQRQVLTAVNGRVDLREVAAVYVPARDPAGRSSFYHLDIELRGGGQVNLHFATDVAAKEAFDRCALAVGMLL